MTPRATSSMLLALALTAVAASQAAVDTPQASPGASVSQKVGTTDLTLRYHRPAVKGRLVWGELVPWGEVWRLGANEATTLEISHDARIGGQAVPAGRYALFAIPGRDEWTFILSKRAQQWGAFSYKLEEDLVRFTARPEAAPHNEWMSLAIEPAGTGAASVVLHWEKVKVGFPVAVDVERIVWHDLDAALAANPADGDVLLQAARYARETGERLGEAMGWIDRSIAAGESWWNLETKADLLRDAGSGVEAIQYLERALASSRGKTPEAYQQGLEKRLAEWRAAQPR